MMATVVRMFQKYDRITYRGDWYGQQDMRAIISRPAFGVPVAFYEPEKE